MIAFLRGKLLEKSIPSVILDVGGVGYELEVPMSTYGNLPPVGETVQMFVQMVVREDAMLLYGFLTREEKRTFQILLKVSGIGAKIALAVLSGMSVSDLAAAVSQDQTDLLTRVPGIGKKTAARLILELKGKLGADLGSAGVSSVSGTPGAVQADIVAGLMALGFTEREASASVKKLPADVTASEGIRLALRARA